MGKGEEFVMQEIRLLATSNFLYAIVSQWATYLPHMIFQHNLIMLFFPSELLIFKSLSNRIKRNQLGTKGFPLP